MSDDDITAETWWRREIVTDELDEACDAIAAGLRIPRGDVGTKGNVRHLRGHHRSQEWILRSSYCTNRRYTVQAGLTDDQLRHIAAIDITPGEWGTTANRRRVAAITARLVAAMRAGELDEVFEVYGADTDLTSVTGYNNRENREASSDDSHLDHVHVGIDRRKLRDRAALGRLVAVILGEDMSPENEAKLLKQVNDLHYGTYTNGGDGRPPGSITGQLDQLVRDVAAVKLIAEDEADLDALAEKVAAKLTLPTAEQIAAALVRQLGGSA